MCIYIYIYIHIHMYYSCDGYTDEGQATTRDMPREEAA